MDVVKLRDFYASPMGRIVRRLLRQKIRSIWGDVRAGSVIGLGFASPFLGLFRNEAASIAAFMPAHQGVLTWPSPGPRQAALVDGDRLPLPDASIDFVLAAHAIEMIAPGHNDLNEIWRILRPEGKLLAIVPNRRSVWARFESTPFGHGRPFSKGQLSALLLAAQFNPQRWAYALHLPPSDRAMVLRMGPSIERMGARLWPGGAMLVEAGKQVAAPVGTAVTKKLRLRAEPISATAREAWRAGPYRSPGHGGRTARSKDSE